MEPQESGSDSTAEAFSVALDGFEGPIDVLLALAKAQKVNLLDVALAPLTDAYLAFLEQPGVRLDDAAEYLVMAAWLAWLKSRLLLPKPARPAGEPDAQEEAAGFLARLAAASEIRSAAARLDALPQVGRDVFLTGAPATASAALRAAPQESLHDLLRAYGFARRHPGKRPHKVAPRKAFALEAARAHLENALPGLTAWRPLESLMPERPKGQRDPSPQSVLASMLGASLEFAKEQRLELGQEGWRAPVNVRRRGGA